MEANIKSQIKSLSVSERILLAEEIWDSIAEENSAFELTPSQKEELDKRLALVQKNANTTRSWEEIKADFISR